MLPLTKKQIQELASLKIKKYRDRQGLYIISGLNTVEQCVSGPYLKINKVVIENGREPLLKSIKLPGHAIIQTCSAKDFKKISDENTPQGILLVVQKPDIDKKRWYDSPSDILYLHEINDPGNLGAIFRTALWYGIKTILLSGNSADPYQPKVARSSAGSITYLKIIENVHPEWLSSLKEKNVLFIGTDLKSGQPPEKIAQKIDKPWLLMMGSEAHGLNAGLLRLCDHIISISGKGIGESLNLAVSAGICLHILTNKP
ncbi:MAG: RNA methyltransferase [Calditrichaceae bacterium]|nr:RNA methyltransferase [Calditrichaceae bacterium]MBN2709238.1 RNA methyltransferase [Calditrichaceae bacterium]RQV96191.1 MAG: RNA methyltransferase [Calditrichota bacterium]